MSANKAKVEEEIVNALKLRIERADTIEKLLNIIAYNANAFLKKNNLLKIVQKKLDAEIMKLKVVEKKKLFLNIIKNDYLKALVPWATKALESEEKEIEEFCIVFHHHETVGFLRDIVYEKGLDPDFRKRMLLLLEREIAKTDRNPKRIHGESYLEKLIKDARSHKADYLIKEWANAIILREIKAIVPKVRSVETMDEYFGNLRQKGKFLSFRMEAELKAFVGYTEAPVFCEIAENILKENFELYGMPRDKIDKLKRYLDIKCRPQFKEYLFSSIKTELSKITEPMQRLRLLLEPQFVSELFWNEVNVLNLNKAKKLKLLIELNDLDRYEDKSDENRVPLIAQIDVLLKEAEKANGIGDISSILYGASGIYKIQLLKHLIRKNAHKGRNQYYCSSLELAIDELDRDSRWREWMILLEEGNAAMHEYAVRGLSRVIDELESPEDDELLIQVMNSAQLLKLGETGLILHASKRLRDQVKDLSPEDVVDIWEDYIVVDGNLTLHNFAVSELMKELGKLESEDIVEKVRNYLFDLYDFGDEVLMGKMFSLFKAELSNMTPEEQNENISHLLDHGDREIREYSYNRFSANFGMLPPLECAETLGCLSVEERNAIKIHYRKLVKQALSRMNIVELANYAFEYRYSFRSNVLFYEMVLDRLKDRIVKKIKNETDLLKVCSGLSNPERILFLQKCVIAFNYKVMKDLALKLLGEEIESIKTTLASRDGNDFESLLSVVGNSMDLFFMDSCRESDNIKRIELLRQIEATVTDYFKANQCSVEQVSKILGVLSENNRSLSLSYPWQWNDKETTFKVAINQLLEKFDALFKENGNCSFGDLSTILMVLRNNIWSELKIPPGLIDSIVIKAELLFKQNSGCTEEEAFDFLRGLVNVQGVKPSYCNGSSIYSAFFAELAMLALPYLSDIEEGPFKFLVGNGYLTNSIADRILRIIPSENLLSNPILMHQKMDGIMLRKGGNKG